MFSWAHLKQHKLTLAGLLLVVGSFIYMLATGFEPNGFALSSMLVGFVLMMPR